LLAALVLGIASAGASAQSLQDLYLAAHGYDSGTLAARASLDAAQLRYDQARGLRLPVVGLQLAGTRQLNATPDSPITQTANTSSLGATLNGSQSLYNPANDATIAQAQKAVDVSHADLDAAEQDLILRVSQAYFDVLGAQDTLTTANSSLKAIAEQVASAKRNFEVGTATITDTREAQARYDLARATLIQAENDLQTKRILLDQTVGRVGVIPRPLAVPVKVPPLVPSVLDEWVARGDAEHPQIRRARLALEIARLDTEKARAGNLPTASVGASYGRAKTNNRLSMAGFDGAYSTPSTNSSIGVTVNVPLFAGFQVQNRIKETLVLEDKSQDDVETARRAVSQATRQLFYSFGSGAAQVAALEAAESSSQLALDATQLGYKVGVRVNIDVLNAQAQLYSTQAQLAIARYGVVMTGLRLRQASGRLTADDVADVNQLLQR
jgi:outer membrane protein